MRSKKTIIDDRVPIIDPEFEPRIVKPTRTSIQGLNQVQKEYLNGLDNDNQIFVTGPAGTGKTFLAAVKGAEFLLSKRIKRLYICRPMVGTESLGYLPGTIDDKFAPWAAPVMETLEHRLGSGALTYHLRHGSIEFSPLAYMRGRSLEGAWIIVDEAQNMTYAQLKMVMTRVGEGSRIVIAGDLEQTDLKEQSGLSHAIRIIKDQGLPIKHIQFTREHIVRSGICRMWAEAFDRYEDTDTPSVR